MRPAGMTSDVFPHHIDDGSPDEAVLDDEREEIGRRLLNDLSHYVDSSARIVARASDVRWIGVEGEARTPDAGGVRLIGHVEYLRKSFVRVVRCLEEVAKRRREGHNGRQGRR